jgi:hypothetical protein
VKHRPRIEERVGLIRTAAETFVWARAEPDDIGLASEAMESVTEWATEHQAGSLMRWLKPTRYIREGVSIGGRRQARRCPAPVGLDSELVDIAAGLITGWGFTAIRNRRAQIPDSDQKIVEAAGIELFT